MKVPEDLGEHVADVGSSSTSSQSEGLSKARSRMVPDQDIYRAAHLPLRRHGADAMIEAARLLGLPLDCGGREARFVWLRVKRAIFALQAPSTGALH